MGKTKSTVDENGKFSYFSADMRPVPPGKCYSEFSLDIDSFRLMALKLCTNLNLSSYFGFRPLTLYIPL